MKTQKNNLMSVKLLPVYFVIGASGQKIPKFPTIKQYKYDNSQEPKKLTANYRGRCDDTLFLMK